MERNDIINIISKTQYILNNFIGDDDEYFVILLNSLLSLVVLPVESIKRKGKRIFYGSYKTCFLNKIVQNVYIFDPRKIEKGTIKKANKTLHCFFEKLRNGIAHQSIDFYKNDDGEKIVRIYNVNKLLDPNKIDFDIRLDTNQLKKLSFYISNCYLQSI